LSAHRQVPRGPTLVAAQRPRRLAACGGSRARRADRQDDPRAHGARLDLQGTVAAILPRKQINVVRTMLKHWCICVMRFKVEPMKAVAALAPPPGGHRGLGTNPPD